MKRNFLTFVAVVGFAFSTGLSVTAQTHPSLGERMWTVPKKGTFYSMQSGLPFPFVPFDVPVYVLQGPGLAKWDQGITNFVARSIPIPDGLGHFEHVSFAPISIPALPPE